MPKIIGRLSLPYAALAALAIEAALIATLFIGLSVKKVGMRSSQAAVMLSFPVIAEPTPPKPVVKPVPKPPVKPPRPKPIHHVVHRPPVHKVAPSKPVAMAPPATDTVPAPSQPTPEPQAAATTVSADIMSQFEEQVHAAIQAALQYPFAAKVAHIEGRVKVSFEYIDGRVSAIKIISASDYGMFNSAAQQAVLSANYPPPPNNMVGRHVQFEVWVRFDQVNASAS